MNVGSLLRRAAIVSAETSKLGKNELRAVLGALEEQIGAQREVRRANLALEITQCRQRIEAEETRLRLLKIELDAMHDCEFDGHRFVEDDRDGTPTGTGYRLDFCLLSAQATTSAAAARGTSKDRVR